MQCTNFIYEIEKVYIISLLLLFEWIASFLSQLLHLFVYILGTFHNDGDSETSICLQVDVKLFLNSFALLLSWIHSREWILIAAVSYWGKKLDRGRVMTFMDNGLIPVLHMSKTTKIPCRFPNRIIHREMTLHLKWKAFKTWTIIYRKQLCIFIRISSFRF